MSEDPGAKSEGERTAGLVMVHKPLVWRHYTPTETILRLLGAEGNRKRAMEIFRGRASHEQIKNWRRGKARPPAWARELLQAEIRAIQEELAAYGAAL